MASGSRGIWAIDVGNNSLKALRMRSSGDNIEIIKGLEEDQQVLVDADYDAPKKKSRRRRGNTPVRGGRLRGGRRCLAQLLQPRITFCSVLRE